MSKFPLHWHRTAIANAKAHLLFEKKHLEQQAALVTKLTEDIAFCEKQLAEAERRNLAEYDPERFLITRNGGRS